mmetsp:Transcript_26610/g.39539  ORF Transcript_26610/g.39539 Transcript_26610/m.39539 type:complete len:134 (-) Transcript_26610:94-495(-)
MTSKKPPVNLCDDETRKSGIPRNYFLFNGVVLNSRESIADKTVIKRAVYPDSGVIPKLCNSPERAAKLMRKERSQVLSTPSPASERYRRFVVEGPRITDGSFIPELSAMASSRSRTLLLPSHNKDKLLCNLQR